MRWSNSQWRIQTPWKNYSQPMAKSNSFKKNPLLIKIGKIMEEDPQMLEIGRFKNWRGSSCTTQRSSIEEETSLDGRYFKEIKSQN